MTDTSLSIDSHAERVDAFFNDHAGTYHSESGIVAAVLTELSHNKTFISNKEIIGALLHRLETERDVVQQDILRKALEVVVQKTPDDLL